MSAESKEDEFKKSRYMPHKLKKMQRAREESSSSRRRSGREGRHRRMEQGGGERGGGERGGRLKDSQSWGADGSHVVTDVK